MAHHEWRTRIHDRTSHNSGCPFCCAKGARLCPVDGCNSLGARYPHLQKEWHSSNKKDIMSVMPGSKEKYWWICPENHIYQSRPNDRTGSITTGCPYCRPLRSENFTREVFEDYFRGYSFPKVRPSFLGGLELDGYCQDLNLAFEYDGQQHFQWIKAFSSQI